MKSSWSQMIVFQFHSTESDLVGYMCWSYNELRRNGYKENSLFLSLQRQLHLWCQRVFRLTGKKNGEKWHLQGRFEGDILRRKTLYSLMIADHCSIDEKDRKKINSFNIEHVIQELRSQMLKISHYSGLGLSDISWNA